MSRDDSDEIHRRLNDDLEQILDRYWSGWITEKRKGQDIALLTPRVKAKGRKATSSFTVNLGGSDRGKWYRFSRSVGGSVLGLIYYAEHDSVPNSKSEWAEAYKIAKDFLGIEDRRDAPEDAAEREKRKAALREQNEREAAQRKAEAAAEAQEKELTVKEIWKGTIPILGTHGEAYLVERGLPPISEWPWNPDLDLRFHPSLFYGERKRFPAIVARVSDQFGSGIGIWRIFLDHKKPQKAPVSSAKLGLGSSSGGAVRIGGTGPSIGVAEGVETALGAWALEGFRKPVWSLLSTSGMRSFEPSMELERIEIFPDGDRGKMSDSGKITERPGISAARDMEANLKNIVRISIAQEPQPGRDYLDIYVNAKKRGLIDA